jgi:NADH-quinone oxidoreductase subunit G
MNEVNTEASSTVTIKIDGIDCKVPAGVNVIEAAKSVGVEIPHYCYHPDLSVPGNCRMCQVEVVGMPKLTIACNTVVKEGMEVRTEKSSPQVKDTQAATLEFILINHPLDCTVCDQAGHCKLQDYHYEYNAKPSRFIEDKVEKVKAFPLGPTVNLDGERCISCTRCVRFCDEITGTSELGLVNRGDKSVITVNQANPLDNPLSGTVVDLCPVGALTHEKWRFNTRIWFTKQTNSICPGCSTGCNVKVAERDGKVVLVKAKYNALVNKEWLCDEGRYGFGRFEPESRIHTPLQQGQVATWPLLQTIWKTLTKVPTAVLFAPDCSIEDYIVAKEACTLLFDNVTFATQYKERPLSKVEKVLVSPDYAPNFRGAQFAGVAGGNIEREYQNTLTGIREEIFGQVLIIGDNALLSQDCDDALLSGLAKAKTIACLANTLSPAYRVAYAVAPVRTVLERSGLFINRNMRLQYFEAVVPFLETAVPIWRWFAEVSNGAIAGNSLSKNSNDRDATLAVLKREPRFESYKISTIKSEGIDVRELF